MSRPVLWLPVFVAITVSSSEYSQTSAPAGPYARIASFHPRDGHTVEFEAGYIRHLAWHQQVKDSAVWYGWTVSFGERQRWFVYATFGHAADSFDTAVAPADDERDNILNVAPHVEAWTNALYVFLPALSKGTGVPTPAPRLELTTIDLEPGAAGTFEDAIAQRQSALQRETLWFRMVAGGPGPRYVRLRPRSNVQSVLEGQEDQQLPERVTSVVAKMSIEILTLRPAMSLGLDR